MFVAQYALNEKYCCHDYIMIFATLRLFCGPLKTLSLPDRYNSNIT